MRSPAESASTNTALFAPRTEASGCLRGSERRVHPRAHALDAVRSGQPLADREELHDVPGLAAGADLLGRDRLDALDGHRRQRHAGVEGEAREDRRLLRRVGAADVARRVRLRVAEPGRLRERVLEAVVVLVHPVEDEVRRAVDDAEDPVHVVAREAVAERPDDRDRAADRGLVVQLRADALGRREQLGAVRREQRLVAGDDVRAALERQRARARGPARRRRSARPRCARRARGSPRPW